VSNACSDIVACLADQRIVRKRLAFFVENIEKPVSRGGIIAGDMIPNVDQILFSLRRPQQTRLALAHGYTAML
jgi:hypothetical protein